jgi:copper chaperone CopZ
MGCAATVRGALQNLPGVSAVDVTPGNKVFTVVCNRKQIDPATMLAALKKAGEPANLVE